MKRALFLLIIIPVLLGNTRCTKTPPPALCTPGVDLQLQTEVRWVEVDPALTQRVSDPAPGKPDTSSTNNEATLLARQREVLLEQCNLRLDDIGAIRGAPVDP